MRPLMWTGTCGESGLTLTAVALSRLDVEESCRRHCGAGEIRDAAVRRKPNLTQSGAALLSAKPRGMTESGPAPAGDSLGRICLMKNLQQVLAAQTSHPSIGQRILDA
jgi:hypothetical protein